MPKKPNVGELSAKLPSMSAKLSAMVEEGTDPDEVPELTDEYFERAAVMIAKRWCALVEAGQNRQHQSD